MTELQKIKRAKSYIARLAAGSDPLSGDIPVIPYNESAQRFVTANMDAIIRSYIEKSDKTARE